LAINWVIRNKKADFDAIQKEFGITAVTARLLANRGFVNVESIREFLNPNADLLYDPLLISGLEHARDIINEKIHYGMTIRVIGDYDVDGIMSTYLLYTALRALGADVDFRIPDRKRDGYGLSMGMIEDAHADGIDTIVTCDNGVSANKEIDLAFGYGMTVIVTDHHDIPECLPVAAAVVNPKLSDSAYPNKHLCGAGVAYKLIQALYAELAPEKWTDAAIVDEMLTCVAFATVADVMPLVGENRYFCIRGLSAIGRTRNLGLRKLIDILGINPHKVTAADIGFKLAPCLNASGRLTSAMRSVDLLLADSASTADKIARELVMLNDARKDQTSEGEQIAYALIEQGNTADAPVENFQYIYCGDPLILLYLPEVDGAVSGIIAGRIKERYNKPTIILTNNAGIVRGSGRSTDSYNMHEHLSNCNHLFLSFGGHPAAAGFSIAFENLAALSDILSGDQPVDTDQNTAPKVTIDMELAPSMWNSRHTDQLYSELCLLEPTGAGNDQPLFVCRSARICKLCVKGKKSTVLTLVVKDNYGYESEVIAFAPAETLIAEIKSFYDGETVMHLYRGEPSAAKISFVYTVSQNEWNGRKQMQLTLQHYRLE
jgi:single-stranded-DNA-specific exonuclease